MTGCKQRGAVTRSAVQVLLKIEGELIFEARKRGEVSGIYL